MNEFDFIERLKNKFSRVKGPQSAIRVGIGDDCAVVQKNAKTDLVITADMLVEDIDFRLSWSKPEFIGHKALAISLSDVAAMGAKPVWAMLSIGVPAKIWRTNFVEKFYDGWFRLAKKFDVQLIGGDVSKTLGKIAIDSIVAGEVKKGKSVLRSGAKVGDSIFVTGKLGGAALGLSLLESGERYEKSKYKKLLRRQLAPNSQTEIGIILGAKNLATAMIDLSDGLSSDLNHLCRESKVGAKIFADKIPFEKNFHFPANSFDEKLDYVLNGGEDFELLFTVSPKKKIQLTNALENRPFFYIGEVTSNAEIIELIANEQSTILQSKGFRHF